MFYDYSFEVIINMKYLDSYSEERNKVEALISIANSLEEIIDTLKTIDATIYNKA